MTYHSDEIIIIIKNLGLNDEVERKLIEAASIAIENAYLMGRVDALEEFLKSR